MPKDLHHLIIFFTIVIGIMFFIVSAIFTNMLFSNSYTETLCTITNQTDIQTIDCWQETNCGFCVEGFPVGSISCRQASIEHIEGRCHLACYEGFYMCDMECDHKYQVTLYGTYNTSNLILYQH